MTPRRDLFITYTVLPTPQRILFGGGASAPAIARGSIRIAGPSGTVTLEDVLHVPELACNLLSLPTATRRGVQVAFSAGGEQVVFSECDGKVIATGSARDGLFFLDLLPP